MRKKSLLSCLWPGLSQLWLRGDYRGLLTAVVFSALLNLAITASFLYPELVGFTVKATLWLLLGGLWTVSAWQSWHRSPDFYNKERGLRQKDANEDLFQQAQTEYLKGHWYEAETLLGNLTESDPDDVEAQFMLASLYRHTLRLGEARRQLRQLEQLEAAQVWQWEIQFEKQLLTNLVEEAASNNKQEKQEIDPNTSADSLEAA